MGTLATVTLHPGMHPTTPTHKKHAWYIEY
jgi:hypothetical protein